MLYRRYVDDIIWIFNSESDANKFFVFLNKHLNIEKKLLTKIYVLIIMETIFQHQFIAKSTLSGLAVSKMSHVRKSHAIKHVLYYGVR